VLLDVFQAKQQNAQRLKKKKMVSAEKSNAKKIGN